MKLFSFLISFLLLINSNAQTITNYTTTDGLLDNFVECIDVDNNDNIWFGTSIGAQMFDGTNWNSFNMTVYPGMASDNIKVMTAMNNGDIWIDMTKEMLIESWGNPEDEKEDVSREKTKLKWYYASRTTRQGTTAYKHEVHLENDIVEGWKELE